MLVSYTRLVLLLVFFLFCFSSGSQAQQITIASFNLRYDNPRDSGNLWKDRVGAVTALIRFHGFDVFGIQEGLKNQLDDIIKVLPEYTYYGVGRDDGKEKGEHSAVFLRKDKFKILTKGDFWLSQTPDKPSLGWDATCCHRICSWVYLQHTISGKRFYFFNAHYDHQGVEARKESSKLIVKKIKEIAGNHTTIFTGDLNGDQQSDWYKTIAASCFLKDSFYEVKNPYANNGSFNGFGATVTQTGIIDHIFISKDIAVKRWGILTDTYHGKYPSDHFPVMAEISFQHAAGK